MNSCDKEINNSEENIKIKTHFVGNTLPEIFIGRHNYPNINAGILSSNFLSKDIEDFSMPEVWFKKKFSIDQILSKRTKLVYGRFKTQISKIRSINKEIYPKNYLLKLIQEISISYKPVSIEFFLKKPPAYKFYTDKNLPLIGNPAPLEFARVEENLKVTPKIDNLINDKDCKANDSIKELYYSGIKVSNISRILSVGLLGLKTQRKLVPTRWSITAVDDLISKDLLKKIRFYKEINDILVFSGESWGNHYEILLLPEKFSFEVIEAERKESFLDKFKKISIMHDYEFFYGRKDYAKEVSGAYYANRLALCEYLERIKRQASAIFFREIREEYHTPLGVGILREICRDAFLKKPEKFSNIKEALENINSRLKTDVSIFTENSVILKNYRKQTRLNNWINNLS